MTKEKIEDFRDHLKELDTEGAGRLLDAVIQLVLSEIGIEDMILITCRLLAAMEVVEAVIEEENTVFPSRQFTEARNKRNRALQRYDEFCV